MSVERKGMKLSEWRRRNTWLSRLRTLEVWFADIWIVISSWILGEISKFDALIIRPSKVRE